MIKPINEAIRIDITFGVDLKGRAISGLVWNQVFLIIRDPFWSVQKVKIIELRLQNAS